jgi:archaemetzincin
VVPPPTFAGGLEEVEAWKTPVLKGNKKEERVGWTSKQTQDVLGYLKAFYHGMEVKMMPGEGLRFIADVGEDPAPPPPAKKARGSKSKGKAKETKSPTPWLQTSNSTSLLGVRTRATKGLYSHQLNLNDLLEAAMEILPQDAYAILMLIEHDMFEDEEDDFACGRAYGGSRVCVVSTSRYDPALDAAQDVPRDHAWPASHCKDYIEKCVEEADEDGEEEMQPKKKKQKKSAVEKGEKGQGNRVVSPMQTSLTAHISLPSLETSPSADAISGLWLGRVCRTASHEIGHCFGMDHCVFYACCMQGTASIIEDARQPPYLCPVDLQKVLRATGAIERKRYEKLVEFCEKFREVQMFTALAAWIRGTTGESNGEKEERKREDVIIILD